MNVRSADAEPGCSACFGIVWRECVRCRRWSPCALCAGGGAGPVGGCVECVEDPEHADPLEVA